MALYSDKVMDTSSIPGTWGSCPTPMAWAEVGNAKCGDIMRMYIQVDPETK